MSRFDIAVRERRAAVVAARADALAVALETYGQTRNWESTARALNERGFLSPNGTPYRGVTAKRLVTMAVLSGMADVSLEN